jgi:hypothetical protein
MNKDHRVELCEDDVRGTGKALAVKPEAEAHAVQNAADNEFRSGVPLGYGSHDRGSFCA